MKLNIDAQTLTAGESVVYLITNYQSGKVYVGSTAELQGRIGQYVYAFKTGKGINRHLRRAARKYGGGVFEMSVLEAVSPSDKLEEREQWWIEYYRSWDRRFGYNFKRGDEVSRWAHDEDTKRLISASQPNRKPVLQFTMQGKFIAEFTSLEEAARATESSPLKISKCCKGALLSTRKYRWAFAADCEKSADGFWRPLRKARQRGRSGKLRGVVQVDAKTGAAIREFASMREASEALGRKPTAVQSISDVCRGVQKTAYGFVWKYSGKDSCSPQQMPGRKVSEQTRRRISEAQKGKPKPPFSTEHRRNLSKANQQEVEQLTLDGEVVCRHSSVTAAAEAAGLSTRMISLACSGRYKTAAGFRWRKPTP